jgi:hypothetical protein
VEKVTGSPADFRVFVDPNDEDASWRVYKLQADVFKQYPGAVLNAEVEEFVA